METFLTIIVLVGIVVVVVFVKKKKNEKIKSLKAAYDSALQGTDKQKAVAAGRAILWGIA